MAKWSLCLFVGLVVPCIAWVPAVIQQWNYDPTDNPPLVAVKIVNNSHKDITAFNIAIKET